MSVQVTDTHPLVWYTLNKHSSLSPKVLAAFKAAAGEAFIYIPAVVLWGIAMWQPATPTVNGAGSNAGRESANATGVAADSAHRVIDSVKFDDK